jgi:cytoskeleton protein RodZ
MDKAGERLKKIRLGKGISIEEVAKKTKVALSILKAIEEDGFINLEPIYIKGFIKIYCNYLGVPPSDFIAELKEPQVEVKLSDDEEKATTFLHPLPVRRPFPWVKVLMVAGAVIIFLFFARFVRGCIKQQSKVAPVVVSVPKKTSPRPLAPAPKKAAAKAIAQNKSIPVKSNKEEQAGIRLGIHAKDDCWVQVKVDGKTIFQSVLFRGRMESWAAQERIDLWLGSAGGVELEVNGSRIPSLGRKGQVLKNIVISKDGLKVGK